MRTETNKILLKIERMPAKFLNPMAAGYEQFLANNQKKKNPANSLHLNRNFNWWRA